MKALSKSNWGPTLWKFLHTISETYDPGNIKQKDIYTNLFFNFGDLLPCPECAKHYLNYLHEKTNYMQLQHALNSSNNNALILWVIDLHNHVNLRLDKQIADFNEHAKFIRNTEQQSQNHTPIILMFIATIFIVFFLKCFFINGSRF